MDRIQVVRTEVFKDRKEGFSYKFEPVTEESIRISSIPTGYEVRYLAHDEHDGYNPNDDDDNGLFLVAFHRDFSVERKNFITKDQCVALFRNDKTDEDYPKDIAKNYYVFGLEAYIHSGVVLAISNEGNFCDRQWDVSQLGCVFVAKTECKTMAQAKNLALGLIKEWNYHLSGDVYGCVIERFNKKKQSVDYASCWGYCGYEEALAELDNFNY